MPLFSDQSEIFLCEFTSVFPFQRGACLGSDRACLTTLKCDFCLVDIWHKNNPPDRCFTWSTKLLSQASHLDRFLISRTPVQPVGSCCIFSCAFSDHDFDDLTLFVNGLCNK